MTRRAKQPLHRSFRPCRDFLVVMLPLLAFSIYFYGARPIIIIMIAAVTAVLCDLLNSLLRQTPYDPSDISSILFAEVFAMLMPAAVNYGVIIAGVAITTLLGKHAFGGYENYPFHPAAFGVSLAAVCWPGQVFSYSRPFAPLLLGFDSGAELVNSSAHSLSFGGVPYVEISDLVAGNFVGALGATFGLVIIASLALLSAHHAMTAHVSLSFILTCAAFAFIFPRIPSGRLESVLYEVFSSAILFCAVFLAGEPSASPKNNGAKILYGFAAGLLTMLFRYYGQFDFGACFALLLVGPMSGFFDRKLHPRVRRHKKVVVEGDEINE